MLLRLLLLGVLASGVMAGSICPPRENIYPCKCTNFPIRKNLYLTVVSCHHLQGTDSFSKIFPSLRSMQIDTFHLYDSFWDAHRLGDAGEKQKVLPPDWLTLLKIKEMDIVDTTLSSCFACQPTSKCRNTVTTRFSAVNSSSHEKICTVCDSGHKNTYSWTACMARLRHFHFSHGKLASLEPDFFPQKMNDLVILNLTHNEIATVHPDSLTNLPRLKSLDLSHNAIRYLNDMFKVKMNLEFLDLSWNSIEMLGDKFFSFVPFLKTFKVDNNQITYLEESEWKVPSNIKIVDLTENPLHCDCRIQWINSTFHINVVLTGHCATPEEYENSLLRRASRFLNQRCVGSSIGTRYRPRSTTPITKL